MRKMQSGTRGGQQSGFNAPTCVQPHYILRVLLNAAWKFANSSAAQIRPERKVGAVMALVAQLCWVRART